MQRQGRDKPRDHPKTARKIWLSDRLAEVYYGAAMESSSYMQLGKVMRWFTGNIGFHHIHHLNVRIPFYRLPEVMDAIPELQSPVTTTLRPRDIRDCFRCCLWDEDRQRVVSYREAAVGPV